MMFTMSRSQRVLSPRTLRTTGALLTTQIAVSRLIETEAVEPTGYDPTVLDLLVRLDQAPNGQQRAVDLSQRLLMSPSHISRMIDRAEEKSLVKREPDPSDRRATLVTLMPQGREVLRDFAPRLTQIIRRIVNNTMTASETDTLVELLGRIEKAALGVEDPATSE